LPVLFANPSSKSPPPTVCGLVVVIQQADRLNTPQGQTRTHSGAAGKKCDKDGGERRKSGGKWGKFGEATRAAIRLGSRRRIQTNNNHATIVRAANKLLFYVYAGV